MSWLERILACRRHDLTGMLPFEVAGTRYGWLRPAFAEALWRHPDVFPRGAPGGRSVSLASGLRTPEERTQAVEHALRALHRAGRLASWRGERYPVVTEWGASEAFRVERAAAPALGVRAFGVHLNAWVASAKGPLLWVARRSRTKPSSPGKLDHLVAGGQPAGLTLRENLAKECAEEAGLPEELAARAVPVAPFAYRLSTPEGLRDDTLFVYDLELPAHFTPRPMDGEVEEFMLWPAAKVGERLRTTDDFKFNVGACILGFLLRRGVLGPDDPEYAAVVAALGPETLQPCVAERTSSSNSAS